MNGYVNTIIKGDCLDVMDCIEKHSIDMVLCDLPYGQTQNKWDKPIDLERLWNHYNRVVKPNGAICLTSQGVFTGKLITSNINDFKYKIVWIKSKATNFLNANKQPLRRHEDICIFYKQQPYYEPQKVAGVPYDRGWRRDNKSGTYGDYHARHVSNADGKRFPNDVLFFEEDIIDWMYFKTAEFEGGYHPTQKPVSLGRWLIRTFTKPEDIVLDNACGSGSFLVAAVLESRQFVGIEKNEHTFHFGGKPVDFIGISNERVAKAHEQKKLNPLF